MVWPDRYAQTKKWQRKLPFLYLYPEHYCLVDRFNGANRLQDMVNIIHRPMAT